jgi:hypothetical protein
VTPLTGNTSGFYSNDQSLLTALLSKLSGEGLQYIHDLAMPLDLHYEANAAQYVEYLNQQQVCIVADRPLGGGLG